MPDERTIPALTPQGHLMLAAFGERSTLAGFQGAIASHRPELQHYTEQDCLTGLEALADVGLLERVATPVGPDAEWAITDLGNEALFTDHAKVMGPPSAVAMVPHEGVIATTETEL